MRRIAFTMVCIALLTPIKPKPVQARFDPIRFLTAEVIRPEIVILFDNSGSMSWQTDSTRVGSDCSGQIDEIDICGDLRCTGYENIPGAAADEGSVCASDCQIGNYLNSAAGNAPKCTLDGNPEEPSVSRMAVSKRAMQNVLSEFRSVASFGFATFKQTAAGHSEFYHYWLADKSDPNATETVAIYLTRWELEAGGWVSGEGWDTSSDAPKSSFTKRGVTYTRNGGTAGDSLYRRDAPPPPNPPDHNACHDDPDTGKTLGDWEYCTPDCPCTVDEGDCDEHADCEGDLICVYDIGASFAFPLNPNNSTMDVCKQPSFLSGSGYLFVRTNFAGLTYNDGTDDWEYVGSYYSYTAHPIDDGPASLPTSPPPCNPTSQPTAGTGIWNGWNGCSSGSCGVGEGDCDGDYHCHADLICGSNNGADYLTTAMTGLSQSDLEEVDLCVPAGTPECNWLGWDGCTEDSRCLSGQGDCDSDSQCESGLQCFLDVGAAFWNSADIGLSASDTAGIDVCLPGNEQFLDQYKGPEFEDTNGRWLYHRFGPLYTSYGVSTYGQGQINVSLIEASGTSVQANYDQSFGELLNRMNDASNGGLWGLGSTPTCDAIAKVRDHYAARINGTSPFSAADQAGDCRPRYLLVISDGESSPNCSDSGNGGNMGDLIKDLYDNYGVKSYAVTIPGISGSGIKESNLISDVGDDGIKNNSSFAFLSNNERDLVNNIRNALFDAIKGQFTTSSAGVASSGTAQLIGDLAVVPSTQYPGWYGHLKTVDLTKEPTDPDYELWDAGEKLVAKDWKERNLYTGLSSLGGGAPIPLLDPDGNGDVNLDGSCTNCGDYGVKDVWPGTPPSDSEIEAVIKWLAGATRAWKLAPLIRTVPATVGPPPIWNLTGNTTRAAFESNNTTRQKLVYVASNDGLLHAFDLKDGREMYAYIPPALLPKLFKLYEAGGQDSDPKEFKYIMAGSPRVNDLFDPTLDSPGEWRTFLTQVYGPGGEGFFQLDVTQPTYCPLSSTSSSCEIVNDFTSSPKFQPFTVVFNSEAASPSIANKYGETWSLPVMGWVYPNETPFIASGSGYARSAPGEGHFYNAAYAVGHGWDTSATYFSSNEHQEDAAKVTDYSVFADTAAVLADETTRNVMATYQADLEGRIIRYEKANPSGSDAVVDLGETQPIHFPPAIVRRDSGNLATMAFASGAYQDREFLYGSSPAVAFADSGDAFVSTIFIRTEEDGSVQSIDNFTCTVANLCDSGCYSGGTIPDDCIAPSARAMPISAPVIVKNKSFNGELEAFFLYYDPPEIQCSNEEINVGDSWVIRIALSPDGAAQSLLEVKKYQQTQSGGLSIAGGGEDIIVSVSARGEDDSAGVKTHSGGVLKAMGISVPGAIEGWREIR